MRAGLLAPAAALVAGIVLTGCPPPPGAGGPGPEPDRSGGAAPGRSIGSNPPASRPPSGPAPSRPRTDTPASTGGRTPLALVAHPTRPPLDLTLTQARAVLAGRVANWRTLGAGGGRLRLVGAPGVPGLPPRARAPSAARAVGLARSRPEVLAVVPVRAAGPGGRLLTVAGHHPAREPHAYPLTVPGAGPPQRAVTLTVVGDVMLARRVGEAMAASGDYAAPLRPMARRLAAADLTVGNLEGTLSRLGPPRQGDDSFGADPRVRRGLRLAGFDVLSLANNHVGDYGPRSLVETVRLVRRSGIAPVGAGPDRAAARRPVVLHRGGVRFGFLAFDAIGETPAATPTRPGALRLRMPPRTGPLNRADLAALTRAIRSLRARVDVVVVLAHWGQQYTAEPVPEQRLVGRALVDAGADLVVGGHPHWVQGIDLHRGKLIAHSLGNFVFDMDFSEPTQEGVVLEAVFWGARLVSAEFAPYRIGPDFAPRPLGWPRARPIMEQLVAASGPALSAASAPPPR